MDIKQTTLYSAPYSFIDKRGEPILIHILKTGREVALQKMYLSYQPRKSFNGLPPEEDQDCLNWVKDMIDNAINIVAYSFNYGAIGHVALFPMDNGACELLIVVAPNFQFAGIGTELTRNAIQLAYEAGFKKIWLSVEPGNRAARHVYGKCGFQYIVEDDLDDLEMSINLIHYHEHFDRPVSEIVNLNPKFITADYTCGEAASYIMEHKVSALPVVNREQKLVGILTLTDIIGVQNVFQKVVDVLTQHVVAVHLDDAIAKALRLLRSRRIRCIPVVDSENKFIGVIGRREILAFQMKNLWAKEVNVSTPSLEDEVVKEKIGPDTPQIPKQSPDHPLVFDDTIKMA